MLLRLMLLWGWVSSRVRWALCSHQKEPLKWVASSHPGVWCPSCGLTWRAELPGPAEQARRMVRAELARAQREALEEVQRARSAKEWTRFHAYLGSIEKLKGGG